MSCARAKLPREESPGEAIKAMARRCVRDGDLHNMMSMLLHSAFSFVLTVCEHDVCSPRDKMFPPGHAFPTGVCQVMSQL